MTKDVISLSRRRLLQGGSAIMAAGLTGAPALAKGPMLGTQAPYFHRFKLGIAEGGRRATHVTLGPDVATGARPQAVVPPHAWQAAQSLGDWTLVGCTVAPGFDFAGFVLAPAGWSPQPLLSCRDRTPRHRDGCPQTRSSFHSPAGT